MLHWRPIWSKAYLYLKVQYGLLGGEFVACDMICVWAFICSLLFLGQFIRGIDLVVLLVMSVISVSEKVLMTSLDNK